MITEFFASIYYATKVSITPYIGIKWYTVYGILDTVPLIVEFTFA
jgi:hypothetical protein